MSRAHGSPRVLLRPLTLVDAPRIARLTSDWEVARLTEDLPFPAPPVGAEGRILIGQARAPLEQERELAVELPGEGVIGAMIARRRPDAVEIGGWLGRAYWGQGLGAQALKAMTAAAARLWDAPLVAPCPEDSVAGRKALAAVGFVDTGAVEQRFSLARRARMACRRLRLDPVQAERLRAA